MPVSKIAIARMSDEEYKAFLAKALKRKQAYRLRCRKAGLNTNGKPYKYPAQRARWSLK